MIRLDRPGVPPLAADYDLGSNRFVRVTMQKVGALNGHVTYEAQGWQIDADAQFVTDVAGYPIRTPGTQHSLSLSGLAARTATRDPGWVKAVPPAGGVIDPEQLPPTWRRGEGEPDGVGGDGDHYYDDTAGQAWRWDGGEFERIRTGKASELLQILIERSFESA